MKTGFNILNWAAWAPGLNTKNDWEDWALGKKAILDDPLLTPDISFLPSMYRRRLSLLTKMTLKVAFECNQDNTIESVFASRFGEWQQTARLLKNIVDNEELSPAGFSLSVHNTAAGLYSLINKNTNSYTAISAVDATFDAAIIEALGRLQNQQPVLLVLAEENIPQLYQGNFPLQVVPFAIAFLLVPGLITVNAKEKSATETPFTEDLALSFLKWFLANKHPQFTTKLLAFENSR